MAGDARFDAVKTHVADIVAGDRRAFRPTLARHICSSDRVWHYKELMRGKADDD